MAILIIGSNHIPELAPTKSAYVPGKLASQSATFQQHRWMAPLDVTSGNWVNLPIFVDANFDVATEKTTARTVYTWPTLGMDTVNGINNTLFIDNTNTNDPSAEVTFERTWWNQYMYGRWKGIEFHLKNFLVSVERDTSGGIQWKDEPVFEVQYVPIYSTWDENASGVARMCAYTYTTTLKEGIKVGCQVNMGIISRLSLFGKIRNADSPQKVYVKYPTIGEFLKGELIPHLTAEQDWDPPLLGAPQLLSPPYGISIRLINIPRGLSNIKVSLGYSSEMKSHWDLYGRMINQWDAPFPEEGAPTTWNMSVKSLISNKRKRTDDKEDFELV